MVVVVCSLAMPSWSMEAPSLVVMENSRPVSMENTEPMLSAKLLPTFWFSSWIAGSISSLLFNGSQLEDPLLVRVQGHVAVVARNAVDGEVQDGVEALGE